MLTFERTVDYELIRQIATHPKIYPHISDDQSPKPEDYRPFAHDAILYVLVKDDAEVLGFWMFVPQNGVTAEIHTCLLPNAWGARAREAARVLGQWIWENTAYLRIVTTVPAMNRLALRFAECAGMKRFGLNETSFMKHGILHDQILLGISKPSIGGGPCQRQ